MLRTAKLICEEYGGKFPLEKEELKKLPGVGPYTAEAIVSFAHNKKGVAFDANFQKVLGRYLLGNRKAKIPPQNWEKLFETSVKDKWRDFNGAVMDFGNLVCLPKPKCDTCPLAPQCVYFKTKGNLETRRPSKKLRGDKRISSRAVVFLHKDHREYYSQNPKKYEPFLLPLGISTREGIKKYFKDTYGLTLSVRPPHKTEVKKGKRTLSVNAQVLLGKHQFSRFSSKVGVL